MAEKRIPGGYKCKVCGADFYSESEMWAHVVKKHPHEAFELPSPPLPSEPPSPPDIPPPPSFLNTLKHKASGVTGKLKISTPIWLIIEIVVFVILASLEPGKFVWGALSPIILTPLEKIFELGPIASALSWLLPIIALLVLFFVQILQK